jgi:hypothetical protein
MLVDYQNSGTLKITIVYFIDQKLNAWYIQSQLHKKINTSQV